VILNMQTNHQDKEIREVTHFAAARSGMYKQQKALLPSFICALFFKVHHVSTYTWTGNQCGRLDGVSGQLRMSYVQRTPSLSWCA
jgi:hypothetical protein